MIYPEQRGDYFPKLWSETEFNDQFDLLMDEEAFVVTTARGFTQISLIEKIAQFVKSLFGGTDYSQKQRVQAAWLKFLYYGEAQGFLKKEHLDRLQVRVKYPLDYFDPAIKKMANELENRSIFSTSHSDYLDHLREIVIDYHSQNASILAPGLWRKLFTSPLLIDTKELKFYGDTPLHLSQKAITGKIPNPFLALNYLQQAIQIKNDTPEFQEKLAEQLEKLQESYSSELKAHNQKIQSMWITLGRTAFDNNLKEQGKKYLLKAIIIDSKYTQARLQIGKIYLSNKEYSLAQSFLSDLKIFFPHDLSIQIEVGHAYWQENQFEEGLKAYETAFDLYRTQPLKNANHQKLIASVYHQLGMTDLTESMPHRTSFHNLSYLTQAVKIDGKNEIYQEHMCDAYVQKSHKSKENFALLHGQELLKTLPLLQSTVIQKMKRPILTMLLDCSDYHFKAGQNQQALLFLEKALVCFNDPNTKTRVLDLSLRYSDSNAFKSHFSEWSIEHPSDPYLKEKMGDAYWQSNKHEALKCYQESLDLFDQRLFYSTNEEERKDCEHHIANIQARIGQTHLESKSGFWQKVPYDEAITYLEKANALQPNRYASLLFDACLAAAQAEQKKFWSNSSKVIAHYHKAFQVNAQKGDYLIELFQLCIDHQQHHTAVAVYKAMKDTSWANEFNLPSSIYSKIAQILLEKNDHEAALDCLRHAYENDPDHQQYKREYFQHTLALAQKDFLKLKNNVNHDEEEETLQKLDKIAANLEACKEGAESLKKIGPAYSETLLEIYVHLAQRYMQRCLLPEPAKIMGKNLVKEHKKLYEKEIQKTLSYYDKALTIQPGNAALHFDKGALLDWTIDFEQAFIEFNLAVKYENQNPFYHKLITTLYNVVYFDAEKKAMHEQSIKKYGTSNFGELYETWQNEYMSKYSQSVNPHAYTKQNKGWFG